MPTDPTNRHPRNNRTILFMKLTSSVAKQIEFEIPARAWRQATTKKVNPKLGGGYPRADMKSSKGSMEDGRPRPSPGQDGGGGWLCFIPSQKSAA
jgi:hypothetical protein